MTSVDTSQLRRALPWYCWDVPEGEFFPTIEFAVKYKPPGATQLLLQYRFVDNDQPVGRAKPVSS